MSIAEYLKDPNTEVAPKESAPAMDAAEKLRKQVFGIFGSVVVLGLALTGWYVAYRIVAERGTRAESAAVVTIPVPSAAPVPVEPTPAALRPVPDPPSVSAPVVKVAETKPSPVVVNGGSRGTRADQARPTTEVRPTVPVQHVPFERHDVNAQPGEKYWQIAAYGPKSLNDYLRQLEAQGRHPLVAPGPSENIYRILVGPFKDTDALEQARRSIQAMGIEPILRTY